MSTLFSPIQMRSLTLRNRIFVAPMCQYSCRDGLPNEWHLVHLGSRAVGGAALVMAEATAVTAEGRISLGDCGLWNDAQAEAFAPITRFILSHGTVRFPPSSWAMPAGRLLFCHLGREEGPSRQRTEVGNPVLLARFSSAPTRLNHANWRATTWPCFAKGLRSRPSAP
jgi:hypothetical protein